MLWPPRHPCADALPCLPVRLLAFPAWMGSLTYDRGTHVVLSLMAAVLALPFLAIPARAAGTEQITLAPPPNGSHPRDVIRRPAEEDRLDAGVFRAGLKKLGLMEVLDLHLRDFPPEDEIARLLMQRDIRLAEFADRTLPQDQRDKGIVEANRILEQLIADYPDDPRVIDWLFNLAHSLLYDQAESVLSKVLYRDAPELVDDDVAATTRRAVAAVEMLLERLDAEYERIDNLTVEEFEALARRGDIEQLDRLHPQAQYLRLWALFYDSFWRSDDDPLKARQLNEIATFFDANPVLLTASHEQSRVQVQALLLAGMTHHRLNNHSAAREHLDRALSAAGAISEQRERARVEWAITLAWISRARNERDRARYADALATLEQFRSTIPPHDPNRFGRLLVAALTEQSVQRAKVRNLEAEGRSTEADQARERSWRVLVELNQQVPNRRDELFATVWEMIDPSAGASSLDPFEQCAAMAGCLHDANRYPQNSEALLVRAAALGQMFLDANRERAPGLVPQVLYNLGVTEYRRGNMQAAARLFLETARNHPEFDQAERAALLAVHLLSQLYESRRAAAPHQVRDREEVGKDELVGHYREALELVMRRYPGTETEGYWRFYYAQLLDELGQHDQAANQYALVHPGHEHFIEGVFLRLRARAIELQRDARDRPEDLFSLRQRAADLGRLHTEFAGLVSNVIENEVDVERRASLQEMLAQAYMITAEVLVLKPMDRADAALKLLHDFEQRFPKARDLWGRLWRARLVAHERLGVLDTIGPEDATFVNYITADPRGAGRTLQALFQSRFDEAQAASERGDATLSSQNAQTALTLAELLVTWSQRPDVGVSADGQQTILLQRAEAALLAGRFEQAKDWFLELQPDKPDRETAQFSDMGEVRALYGLAEARFQLGQCDQALPDFNRLAVHLSPEDRTRWRALLRDLQCRAALGEPPQDIIKVIQQQKYLFPDLGGEFLADEFEKLLRASQQRMPPG
jgi:hypothetical protein